MAFILANGKQQYFDNSGNPLVGGTLWTMQPGPGITTPKDTWTDAGETALNTNPIILNARGEAQVFWSGAYNVRLETAAGGLIYTVESIRGADDSLRADLASTASAALGAGLVGYRGPQGAPADTVSERLSWDVYVTDPQFGAVNDGATDSTTQLAAAVTYVNSLCDIVINSLDVARVPRLIFPPGLGFRTTATLSIRAGVSVIMQSPLFVVGAAGTALVGIDMIDAKGVDFQSPRSTECIFDVRRVTQSNWSDPNDIGVRIVGLYVGKVFFKRISGFACNANVCMGYGQIVLGDLRDAERQIIITGRAVPEQFTNHLRVIGGAFSCAAGVGAGLNRYGITIIGPSGQGVNTVLCDGQSFELNNAGAAPNEAIPYQIQGAASNVLSVRAINQRNESGNGKFAQLTGAVRNCEFALLDSELEFTYPSSLLLDDQSTGGGSNVAYRHSGATAPYWNEFFNTGRLSERSVGLTSSVMSIVNMECMTDAGAAPTLPTFSAVGGLATFDASQYMTTGSQYYGVRVRLNGARSIAISGRKPSGVAADLAFTCFDAAGAQITTAGAVQVEQSSATLNTGVFGGRYAIGVNPINTAPEFDAVVAFSSTVATVFISVTSKTDGWVLKRADARPEWFSLTSHMREQFVGATLPVALANVTYKIGMVVVNSAPAVGQPKGWRCTVPGVPTFVSEGNL